MVWHVDNKTAPLVKPRKQPVFSNEMRYFTDEIGQAPTIPQADWFNMVQGEIVQLALSLGVTPDKLDDGQIGVALGKALTKINTDISKLPKIIDALGDSRVDGTSQRIVNTVNKLAKDAQTAANLANDKANQANAAAAAADRKAESKMSPGSFGLGVSGLIKGTSGLIYKNAEDSIIGISSPHIVMNNNSRAFEIAARGRVVAVKTYGQEGDPVIYLVSKEDNDEKRDLTNFIFEHEKSLSARFKSVDLSRIIFESKTKTSQVYQQENVDSLVLDAAGIIYHLRHSGLGGYIAVEEESFGVAQAQVNVTSQRQAGTTYTNTTRKTIVVSVTASLETGNNAAEAWIVVDGIYVQRATSRYESSKKEVSVSAHVRPGSKYGFNGSGVLTVVEFRG